MKIVHRGKSMALSTWRSACAGSSGYQIKLRRAVFAMFRQETRKAFSTWRESASGVYEPPCSPFLPRIGRSCVSPAGALRTPSAAVNLPYLPPRGSCTGPPQSSIVCATTHCITACQNRSADQMLRQALLHLLGGTIGHTFQRWRTIAQQIRSRQQQG